MSSLVKKILVARGLKTAAEQHNFLHPDYEKSKHDPFLLPDMKKAVARIERARTKKEKVTIYGDYDIDGMTATVILWESLGKFGLNVATYTPDRFSEGYGLNIDAVEQIAADGTKLIITVDNGTLSFDEIARARELGVDVIVTDHHEPHDKLPDAVAVLNPKRAESQYPFNDLAGCGVAFKLVQALQCHCEEQSDEAIQKNNNTGLPQRINPPRNDAQGLPVGQEKWLLDLVALGTVCDVVELLDENRANVKWGLEVLKKTRRPGLKALLAVAGADTGGITARTLGFVLGPRLNAAGRLETAEMALELLKLHDVDGASLRNIFSSSDLSRKMSYTGEPAEPPLRAEPVGRVRNIHFSASNLVDDSEKSFANAPTQADVNARALELAQKLDNLNRERRKIQDEIFQEACQQIIENEKGKRAAGAKTALFASRDEKKPLVLSHEPVAIVVGDDWHEGVIGIVAAKILEKFEKPAFVMSRSVEFTKGSGRSFGEFSMAAVIHYTDKIIEKGGGHAAAGGLTIKNEKIDEWRTAVQKYYDSLNLKNQTEFLTPKPDVTLENFADLTPELLDEIKTLEPFGHGNEAPVFAFQPVLILARRTMGAEQNHVRYTFADSDGRKFTAVAFDAADKFALEPFDADDQPQRVRILTELVANEWNGRINVEGRLLTLEPI